MSTLAEPDRSVEARAHAGLAAKPVAATARDPRLDFFRGIAMFIILVAHVPNDPWALWIPARFGFSDATEIFVFCSGMASAIAFGGVFARKGWLMGAARVLFRVWQVYWAHIGLFITVAALTVMLNAAQVSPIDYVAQLNLEPFFNFPAQQLVGLITLTYVPNYFDILPMYLVILAMIPIAVAAHRAGGLVLAALLSGLVWLAANLNLVDLPAEPWSTRTWFFNPFGWQLIFFTGFALMRGWLPAPPIRADLLAVAFAILLFSVPFAYFRILDAAPALHRSAEILQPLTDKEEFGMLRYIHFLAIAYLAWAAAGPGGSGLRPDGDGRGAAVWRWLVAVVERVGQQSLAVFVFSMVLAQVLGAALDVSGRAILPVLAVNLVGFTLLVAVAITTGWFKSQPWRARR